VTLREELDMLQRGIEAGFFQRWLLRPDGGDFQGRLGDPDTLDRMSAALTRRFHRLRDSEHFEVVVRESVPWNGSFCLCVRGKSPEGIAFIEAEIDRLASAGAKVYPAEPRRRLIFDG
jgi:hypothetical protein